MQNRLKKRSAPNASQVMAMGFAGVILLGALILMLPISSAEGKITPFVDTLFTATTSVCVTGLIVRDTGSYWSVFGQAVILLMIQIGGLGVVTVAVSYAMFSGHKINLFQRSTLQESVAARQVGGILKLTGFLLAGTLIIEVLGAVLLAPALVGDFGWGRGSWMAIFTSISAFCNAGIDLFGIRENYSSVTHYVGDPLVLLTLAALVILGGLGFLTWDDIRTHKTHWKRYAMQSKVILVTSGLLILIPTVAFFFIEFGDMPFGKRLLTAFFQAVSPRTAGFNSVDLNAMTEPGKMTMIALMLVGGSPGSTAGGMKTTTLAVIVACAVSVFRKRESPQMFGRRVGQDAVSTALTILLLYVGLCVGCAGIISLLEGLPMMTCMYETASAVATVGLTLGITPKLGVVSKCILIILMYFGRVGGLTLISAALAGTPKQIGKLPLEKITVG